MASKIKFTGFATGSTVTMSVEQDGVTAGPETVTWPGPVTPPTFVSPSFDDPTDVFTATANDVATDGNCSVSWAWYNNADSEPTFASGVWTGTTQWTSSGAITANPMTINAQGPAGLSADRLKVVVWNASGQDEFVTAATPNPSVTSPSYTRLGPQRAGPPATTTPTFTTYDLTPYSAGDLLLIAYGDRDTNPAPTVTVAGNSAGSPIVAEVASGAGGRFRIWEYTILGTEGATAEIALSGTITNASTHMLDPLVIQTGAREDVQSTVSDLSSASYTLPVTVTSSSNLVLAYAGGQDGFFGSFNNLTNDGQNGSVSPTLHVAADQDIATGTFNIGFTVGTAASQASIFGLVYRAV